MSDSTIIPNAWPVHQNSLEDRLQVPSHLVVGSPQQESERSRESRCSVKFRDSGWTTATRCGWNFFGEKRVEICMYTERDLFIYCHLTKIYEMNTFYQPILVIFSQISRFEKTWYQNQVSCHLFPLEKRLIVHPQISRGFNECLRKATMKLGLCFIIVGKQVLRTGSKRDASGWSMDFPKNYLSWELQYPEFLDSVKTVCVCMYRSKQGSVGF